MGAFRVSGPVTCVRVEGNEASIKYRFRHASGSAAAFKGGGVEVFIKDSGHGRHGKPADENPQGREIPQMPAMLAGTV